MLKSLFFCSNWKDSRLVKTHAASTTQARCFWTPGTAAGQLCNRTSGTRALPLQVDLHLCRCITEATSLFTLDIFTHINVLCNAVFCGIKFHWLFTNVKFYLKPLLLISSVLVLFSGKKDFCGSI